MDGWRELAEQAGLVFEDERSYTIFNAIVQYRLFGDEERFLETIAAENRPDRWIEYYLEQKMKKTGCSEIVLYGAGTDGRINKKVLDLCGFPLVCFCDGNRRKGELLGKEIIGKEELVRIFHAGMLVVVSSRRYAKEMQQELLAAGIPEENILVPRFGTLMGGNWGQYFDVFPFSDQETVVDGGAYQGETGMIFSNLMGGKYRKIIAFEPSVAFEDAVYAKDLHDLEWHQEALWDRRENLQINGTGTEAAVSAQKGSVPGVTLDSVCGKETVTFIKMDLEGSERKALYGARETIRRDRPKLAVCVYHRKTDLLEIPQLIKELVPEYRMRLRHYNTNQLETVLYCSL